MWLVSPKPEGVYVSTPHEKWTRVTPSSVACAVVNLLLMGVAAWSTQQDQASSGANTLHSCCIPPSVNAHAGRRSHRAGGGVVWQ